jgi:hypothetical protein
MEREISLEQLKYPIGRFVRPASVSETERFAMIQIIKDFPSKLEKAISGWEDARLDTPYRPGGWTVRQVVHHVCDSHINSYCRFRLALTEDNPTIKPYLEEKWAELPDARYHPVQVSLSILRGVHERWCVLMQAMRSDDWKKTFNHPEYNDTRTLEQALASYAWHSEHHLAHVTGLAQRIGW